MPIAGATGGAQQPAAELVIKNAPWDKSAPNITDLKDFPTMGNGENGVANGGTTTGAWGKRF